MTGAKRSKGRDGLDAFGREGKRKSTKEEKRKKKEQLWKPGPQKACEGGSHNSTFREYWGYWEASVMDVLMEEGGGKSCLGRAGYSVYGGKGTVLGGGESLGELTYGQCTCRKI